MRARDKFSYRVRFALRAILEHRTRDSRAFDRCFEMYDGAAVVCALMRRAEADSTLAREIRNIFSNFPKPEPTPWHITAAKHANEADLSAFSARLVASKGAE